MQFHHSGDRFIALNIVGSRRNYLALRFGSSGASPRVWSPIRESGERLRVNAGQVKKQVLAGVDQARREARAEVVVADIHFVESDSPSDTVYQEMARRIVERYLAQPDAFDGSDAPTQRVPGT